MVNSSIRFPCRCSVPHCWESHRSGANTVFFDGFQSNVICLRHSGSQMGDLDLAPVRRPHLAEFPQWTQEYRSGGGDGLRKLRHIV